MAWFKRTNEPETHGLPRDGVRVIIPTPQFGDWTYSEYICGWHWLAEVVYSWTVTYKEEIGCMIIAVGAVPGRMVSNVAGPHTASVCRQSAVPALAALGTAPLAAPGGQAA